MHIATYLRRAGTNRVPTNMKGHVSFHGLIKSSPSTKEAFKA